MDVSCAVPTWVQIADGLRPGQPQEAREGAEPGVPRHGWQFFASQVVEECFFIHGVAPRLTDTQQALVRSQCGPLAAIPFTCCPTSSLTRFDAHVFRVLLLRRLSLCPREAGGRVTLNERVGDLDLPRRGAVDQRRLEVVTDGLPLFHGASSPSIQRWSPRSGVMEDLDLSAPEWTGLLLPVRGDGKKRERTDAPGWWSLVVSPS